MEIRVPGGSNDDGPSLWRRYRFFSAGRIPDTHREWARRQFESGRWLRLHLASSVAWATLVVLGATAASFDLWPYALIPAVISLPLDVLRSRRRVVASLEPPAAVDVLSSLGEPFPQEPATRLPLR
jgi:hypothetical protein